MNLCPHLLVPLDVDPERLRRCYSIARDTLLAEREPAGHWVGELSTSALSTATAVMALHQVREAFSGQRSAVSGQSPESRVQSPERERGRPAGVRSQESEVRGQKSDVDGAQEHLPKPSTINPELTLNAQPSTLNAPLSTLNSLISRGLQWLIDHQNDDGGWGDTVKSYSNISTTMLCHASLVACASQETRDKRQEQSPPTASAGSDQKSEVRSQRSEVGSAMKQAAKPSTINHKPSLNAQRSTLYDAIARASAYIDRAGGVPAVVARYGKDKTFSVPILTHCALAGLVEWREITALPFELACLPAKFYKTVRLPVVSYALPALIAIGQVRHHFAPTRNPITRLLRNRSIERSLKVLERIQPSNGGFLEATPLTSFVTMSLAAKGLADHPVVQKGVEFIVASVRPDGSWPIDTNLATWVTTLAVNALGDDLPEESRVPILNWLLDQQYREVHPFTNADPGGWAWTDLPGGVPDADDTPGAMLAVMQLAGSPESRVQSPEQGAAAGEAAAPDSPRSQTPAWERTRPEAPLWQMSDENSRATDAIHGGVRWLLDLQNRDGGFPTFCRGWGALPFDRSSPDLTAHALRAMIAARSPDIHLREIALGENSFRYRIAPGSLPLFSMDLSLKRGFRYLTRVQHPDGSWLPLWFGNQHAPDDVNPTYGTAKVLAAYRDCGMLDQEPARRGLNWLRQNQNPDGGWGAGIGTPSSVEETSLAVEALLGDPQAGEHVARGLDWLMDRIESGAATIAEWKRENPFPLSPTVDIDSKWDSAVGERGFPPPLLEPAPIGFYFAKLWYFERLYPLIFAVSCLRRAVRSCTSGAEG